MCMGFWSFAVPHEGASGADEVVSGPGSLELIEKEKRIRVQN